MFSRRCATGLTLLELLLALSLSFIITGLLIRVCLSYQQAFLLQEARQEVRDNAASIRQVLLPLLRSSAFAGSCQPFFKLSKLDMTQDHLILQWLDSLGVVTQIDGDHLLLNPIKKILGLTNKTLMISDCEHHETFQAPTLAAQANQIMVQPEKSLSFHYQNNAEIYQLSQVIFTHDPTTQSFYMSLNGQRNIAIAEGVTSFRGNKDQAGGIHLLFQLTSPRQPRVQQTVALYVATR